MAVSPTQSVDALRLRRKKMTLGVLVIILAMIIAALSFFLITGRKPHGVVPVLGLNKPDYLFSMYGKGKLGRFNNPTGLAIDENKAVMYVVDRQNYRVLALNLQGDSLFEIKETTKGKKFISPSYVDVDKAGRVYITDTSQASMSVFDSKGKYLKSIEPKQKGKKIGWVPLGMGFDSEGNLYVAEKGAHSIVKLDAKGNVLLRFGRFKQMDKTAKGGGLFNFPNDVAVDQDGKIYVSDSNNYRLQIFNSKGKFQRIIATGGVPRGLGIIEEGLSPGIYAVNALDQKISVYSKAGTLRYQFGEDGSEDGQFSFPNDIAILNQRLYIADTENNRIQVWSF